MRTDSVDSTVKSDVTIGIGERVLRWFAQITATVIKPAQYFSRTRYPASDGKRTESALEEAGANAAASGNVIADLTTSKPFIVPVAAGVKIDPDAQIVSSASTALDQEEIQRRRDLVRTFFNDFWSEAFDKPVAFVERLDQAEDYMNERLAANGEIWQLDAKTRVMLGLPPTKRNQTL